MSSHFVQYYTNVKDIMVCNAGFLTQDPKISEDFLYIYIKRMPQHELLHFTSFEG